MSISNVHGTQSSPITFGNYGTGNLPVLDGGSTRLYGIVGGSASGQAANSYVTIDGFEVRNTTRGGIIFSYLAQPGITIQNNYVHNNGYGAYFGACSGCFQVDDNQYGYDEGIAFVGYPIGSYGAKILNNTITIEGGHNALMVDEDTGSPLIQGNQVGPGCSHNCFDFKRSTGALFKENTANCAGTVTVNGQSYPACVANAFYTQNDTPATFTETGTYESNVAYGAAPSNACFAAQGQSGPVAVSLTYYNNTCAFPPGDSNPVAFNVQSCLGGALKVNNNIFQGGYLFTTSDCAISWDYNDKYQTTQGGSTPNGAHDMSVDPEWVNAPAFDFHLRSTSPLINAGNSGILGVPYIGACGTSGTCP